MWTHAKHIQQARNGKWPLKPIASHPSPAAINGVNTKWHPLLRQGVFVAVAAKAGTHPVAVVANRGVALWTLTRYGSPAANALVFCIT
jgi:hypothetical protein